jgi:hypothetical protein
MYSFMVDIAGVRLENTVLDLRIMRAWRDPGRISSR